MSNQQPDQEYITVPLDSLESVLGSALAILETLDNISQYQMFEGFADIENCATEIVRELEAQGVQ